MSYTFALKEDAEWMAEMLTLRTGIKHEAFEWFETPHWSVRKTTEKHGHIWLDAKARFPAPMRLRE